MRFDAASRMSSAPKQDDEFIQEAEETRRTLHLEIPTGGIISHDAGGRQLPCRGSFAAETGKISDWYFDLNF